jgi:hypothetical protein
MFRSVSTGLMLCLAAAMTVPAWALQDCCCSRRAESESSCCNENVVPAGVPDCCRARYLNQPSISPERLCECEPRVSPPAILADMQSVLAASGCELAWNAVASSEMFSRPARQVSVLTQPPMPPPDPPSLAALCRWLA